MRNLLLEPIPYKVEETPFGVWRRFASEQLGFFEEFVSHQRLFGLPLLHYTRGRSPETGRTQCALGIVAIGRRAVGVVAIGQLSAGVVAVGQLAIGAMFGLGQATTGIVAIGQAAMGVAFGLGQVTTGFIAIGQGAAGVYVLAMRGIGRFVWDMAGCSPIAKQFFESLIP
ncbi:MAG TPA: hypothetical protein VG125_10645 [Pirellulales bacterium]|jgi:hypothetical protein|nr:hypothetical protein [Pirellulales bacterium]